jgi:hypothetical protein
LYADKYLATLEYIYTIYNFKLQMVLKNRTL